MPDIKNKQDYAEYEKSVADFIAREQLSFLSTGTEDRLDPNIHSEAYTGRDSGEPWFSWHPCECCQSALGGNREYLYARNAANEIVQFEICEDCVYYINYGRLDDSTMMRVAE
jgi:hypothetical protein